MKGTYLGHVCVLLEEQFNFEQLDPYSLRETYRCLCSAVDRARLSLEDRKYYFMRFTMGVIQCCPKDQIQYSRYLVRLMDCKEKRQLRIIVEEILNYALEPVIAVG